MEKLKRVEVTNLKDLFKFTLKKKFILVTLTNDISGDVVLTIGILFISIKIDLTDIFRRIMNKSLKFNIKK